MLPDWGGRDLKIGTLRSPVRQLTSTGKGFKKRSSGSSAYLPLGV